MPTSPDTTAIAQAIQTIMKSATVNGSPAYANTIIGGLKDYTDELPVGVVFPIKGSTERYVLGRSAKIHDKPQFNIASVVSYTNAEQADLQLYAIRDAVVFLFMQSATLNIAGPVVINVPSNAERWSFPTINGNKCRAHEFTLLVTYEYTLPLGPQP